MFSGQRMMTSYFRIGGLALEPPRGWQKGDANSSSGFRAKVDEYENLLTNNPIWMCRTKGVGFISLEDMLDSGRHRSDDARRRRRLRSAQDEPYSSYEKFDFEVPTRTENDVYARYRVRMEEMRQSPRSVQAGAGRHAGGRHQADAPQVVLPDREKMKTQMEALIYHFKIVTEGFRVPAGEVYQVVESPRGEIGYYVVSDGTAKPYRVHMRAACLANLQALPSMCEGRLLADVVAAIGSIDIVLGEIDR